MQLNRAEKIIDGYVNWWKAEVSAYQEGESIRLVCPMLDRNNDHMNLYIADNPEGGYFLTDMGATIDDLKSSGCDVLGSAARENKLTHTLNGYGLQRLDNELYVLADESNLFQKMNMLMQGMASVDDLFFTAKDGVRSIFLEDIAQWFDDNGVRYTPNVRLSGRSGFEAKFDFVIPKTPKKKPERYIKAVGNPSESSVKNAIFGWSDISSIRGDSESFLFLNDTKMKVDSTSILHACKEYQIIPVPWSRAEEYLPELAA